MTIKLILNTLDKKKLLSGYNIVHPLKNDIIIKIKIDDKKINY